MTGLGNQANPTATAVGIPEQAVAEGVNPRFHCSAIGRSRWTVSQ